MLYSCGGPQEYNPKEEPRNDYNVFPTEMEGYLQDKKVYLTSIGQSNDLADTEEIILKNLEGFEYSSNPFLTTSEVEDGSVIVIFVGCSIKALAEVDMTVDEEIERSRAFASVSWQEKHHTSIICIHIGGEKRRGATSDRFIEILFSRSVFNVFLDNSDNDYFLSNISLNNDILAYIITSDLSLEKVFKQLSQKVE